MRKTFSGILAILLLLGFVSFSFAANEIDPMNLPRLTEYVEDFSSVLSSADLASLRQISHDYETKTTNQMVVVLIPDRGGNELFDIGMKVFKDNGIGQKGKDNGILLVIATDEKKIRIVTGYGLEGHVPDVLASDFIEKNIRPLVNEEKYADAIRAFFDRTMKAIGTDEGKKLQAETDAMGIWITSGMAIFFGLAFSFNLFFLLFAAFFFVVASLSIGSIYPVIGFAIGMLATLFIGLHYFDPGFRKNFFQMPKNQGGSGGGSGGWGSSGGGGGFSGGGGSSGGGGAGD